MICNVGGVDRIVRVLVGILLTAGAFFLFPTGVEKAGALTVAALLFASAWFGICFINRLLGVNTARQKE
jgi:Protein of unknown function (DUF2892)